MAWAPDDWLAAIDIGLALLAALVVFALGPGRAQNRLLAALLFFEGCAQWGASSALGGPPADVQAGLEGVFLVALAALSFLYVRLLARLDSPLARPLRSRVVQVALGLLLAAATLQGLAQGGLVLGESDLADRPSASQLGAFALLLAFGAVSLYGLAVSWSAFLRTSRGTLRRAQARAFALAFGARDLFFGAYVALVATSFATGVDLSRFESPAGIALPYFATLLFVPLITFGILQTQLLGIEIRVKLGVRRTALLLPFVAAFFVASQLVEGMTTAAFGYLGGALAAVLLFVAFRPLERLADRIAEVAVPNATGTPAYFEARKAEIYRVAVEAAHESGGISEKERESLRRLREKLGIPDHDAAAVERDVVSV